MRPQSKADYVKLAKALLAKEFTVETVYEVLEANDFSITLSETGEQFDNIYAARVIASMHELNRKDSDKPKKSLVL